MSIASPVPVEFFLYDVVFADGQILGQQALALPKARLLARTWNHRVKQRRDRVAVRRAWRVIPVDGKAVK